MVFHVETREGIKIQFTPNKNGLHVLHCKDYFEVEKDGCVFWKETNISTIEEVSLLSRGVKAVATVEQNKKNFTNQDITWAETTYCFQHMTGHLNDSTLIYSTTTYQKYTNCYARCQVDGWYSCEKYILLGFS